MSFKTDFLELKARRTATPRDALRTYLKAKLSQTGRREINRFLKNFDDFPPLTDVEDEEARLKTRFKTKLAPEDFGKDGIKVNVEAAIELALEITKHFQKQPSNINYEEERNKLLEKLQKLGVSYDTLEEKFKIKLTDSKKWKQTLPLSDDAESLQAQQTSVPPENAQNVDVTTTTASMEPLQAPNPTSYHPPPRFKPSCSTNKK
jgi:hypothetical protein